ncbi:putative nucleic acid-binding protein [Opitutaceae bacterium TAV1]|nr:putative nucleic acid-binding protein [Opitutaceae bacterium TAV1]
MRWVLDTNLLFAAVYKGHEHHAPTRAWLDKVKGDGWGVAAESFVSTARLLMNRTVMKGFPLKAPEALRLLRSEMAGLHPGRIITDVSPSDRFLERAQGHKQMMDFFLVNVAVESGAKFATRDGGILAEWPEFTQKIGE